MGELTDRINAAIEDLNRTLENLPRMYGQQQSQPSTESLSPNTSKFLLEPYRKFDTKKHRAIYQTYNELANWLPVLKHPSVIVILGGRGYGKSALGYKIAEYMRYHAHVCCQSAKWDTFKTEDFVMIRQH